MKVALLRVGIDSGSGGIDGPVFSDGSFEYLPIPDSDGLTNALTEINAGERVGHLATTSRHREENKCPFKVCTLIQSLPPSRTAIPPNLKQDCGEWLKATFWSSTLG